MVKDWRGNEYDVGMTVLYPRMSGKSVEMAEGVVVSINDKGTKKAWVPPDRSAGETTGRHVDVPKYTVVVQPLGRGSRGFGYYSMGRDDQPKKVTITNVENITVPA